MRKSLPITVLALAVLCSGCATTREAVEKAGNVADRVLDEGHSALCSKRFSLRAYEDLLRRLNKQPEELRQWCGWDNNPELL